MIFKCVMPDPAGFLSGGNIYNGNLIAALAGERAEVTRIDLKDWLDKGTTTSQAFTIIDSIYFDELIQKGSNLPGRSVALVHHLESLYPFNRDLYFNKELPLLQSFDAFIVTSKFTREYLLSGDISPERILVLEPVAEELHTTQSKVSDKVNAIILANIESRKGILDFLQALKLANIQPHYTLRIIGNTHVEPNYAKACMELAASDRNLSKTVTFTGQQDDMSLQRLWSKSNLFVSASHMETFGMAIQEAAVRGLPLLVLDGGNAGNHVSHGVNGYVENNVQKLARRFATFIEQPETFRALSTQATGYDTNYARSWSEHALTLIDFLANSIE